MVKINYSGSNQTYCFHHIYTEDFSICIGALEKLPVNSNIYFSYPPAYSGTFTAKTKRGGDFILPLWEDPLDVSVNIDVKNFLNNYDTGQDLIQYGLCEFIIDLGFNNKSSNKRPPYRNNVIITIK